MPITSNGFEARRFQEILQSINSDQVSLVSPDIKSRPDSLLGVLNNIIALKQAEQEEYLQILADSFNIDKARDKFLDDLVALTKLQRLGESASFGKLSIRAQEGLVIKAGKEFLDTSNNTVKTKSDILVSQVLGWRIIVTPILGPNGSVYSFTISGRTYSHTKTAGQTVLDISTAMVALISEEPLISVTLNEATGRIDVLSKNDYVAMNSSFNALFKVETLYVSITAESDVTGPTPIYANTVTRIKTAQTGLFEVNNPNDFTLGRLVESDEELRARHGMSTSINGNCTIPAIVSRVRQVDGVTSVNYLENSTMHSDPATGLPGNSYEIIVSGGSDTDIGEVLFASKPAGIRTIGNTTYQTTYEGLPYVVNFTRPQALKMWVKVTYTVYDEETFPETGEQGIKEAIKAYVDSQPLGKDFLAKRLYGPVYAAVSGIEDLVITAYAQGDGDPDPEVGDYTDTPISIGVKAYAQVSLDRILVSLA